MEPTDNPRISGHQAEWLITRVEEMDRVSHPLRNAKTGDEPANRAQLYSIFYETYFLHQIASEFFQKHNLSLRAADDAAKSQDLTKKLAEKGAKTFFFFCNLINLILIFKGHA